MVDHGIDHSLFTYLRMKTNSFIENKIISNLIIAMTLFLCLVIFSELSIAEQIENNQDLEKFYFVINLSLMIFFLVEITLKLFA